MLSSWNKTLECKSIPFAYKFKEGSDFMLSSLVDNLKDTILAALLNYLMFATDATGSH